MLTLLIDFNQTAFATFFVNRVNIDNISFWKYLMLQSIKKVKMKYNPTEIVLAVDSRSWRKDWFPYYKYSRNKDKDPGTMNVLFAEMTKFIEELQTHFPYKVVQVNGAEGDDVIAILSQYILHDVVIVSSDKDLVQLLDDRVKMYNPFKNIEVTLNGMTKEEYIQRMTLKGDSGDGVPNVMSDSDTFTIEGKYQECMSDRMATDVLKEGLQIWLGKQTQQIKDNYERNRTLITLNEDIIPKVVSNDIKIMYDNAILVENKQKIYDFIVEYQMSSLYDEVDNFYL